MTHGKVYQQFCVWFPQFTPKPEETNEIVVREWFPNGKNSIRVRFNWGTDYIFTYSSETDWKLETVDSFIKTMRKEPTQCD